MDATGQNATSTGIPGAPSPEFALINYLFPGFSVLTSAANLYLGADFNKYLPLLLVLAASPVAWSYARGYVWELLNEYLMTSVTVRTDDEMYNMVMLWLSRQHFARNSRHFLANTNVNTRNRYLYYQSLDEDEAEKDGGDDMDAVVNTETGEASNQKQAVHYTPSTGRYMFWYKSWPFTFERIQNRDQSIMLSMSEREELCISCFGRNPRRLKELLLDARQMHMRKDNCKTVIYRANLADSYWQRCMSRLNRPFSTVILNDQVKQDLIDDATDYLRPSTRRWYANRGIPYRRGYLLHGPPGTGKSSLSLAMAGYFRMKIYIVSLSSTAATEENLTALFHDLPTRCVVLLEDIDSAGLTHTRDGTSGSSGDAAGMIEASAASSISPGSRKGANPAAAGGRISLSGLLNILDGVASQEGRILIMTTNHIEKLDKALIRPGRIDMSIHFGLADSGMSASIFRAIYAPYEDEMMDLLAQESGMATDATDEVATAKNISEKRRSEIRDRVSEQADKFAVKMPDLEFSPAEVQGLLLRHKRNPERALTSVDEWVDQMRRDRRLQEEQKIAEEKKEQQETENGEKEKQQQDSGKSDAQTTQKSGKSSSDSGYETP